MTVQGAERGIKLTGDRKPIVTTVHEYGWWEWQPKGIPPQLVEWLKIWGLLSVLGC